jgi:hypothetical protein
MARNPPQERATIPAARNPSFALGVFPYSLRQTGSAINRVLADLIQFDPADLWMNRAATLSAQATPILVRSN